MNWEITVAASDDRKMNGCGARGKEADNRQNVEKDGGRLTYRSRWPTDTQGADPISQEKKRGTGM